MVRARNSGNRRRYTALFRRKKTARLARKLTAMKKKYIGKTMGNQSNRIYSNKKEGSNKKEAALSKAASQIFDENKILK